MEHKEYNGYSLHRGNATQKRIAKETWTEVQKAIDEIVSNDEYLKFVKNTDTSITLNTTKFVTGGVFIFADVKNYIATKLYNILEDKLPNLKWYSKRHIALKRGKLKISVYSPQQDVFQNLINISQEIEL